MPRNIPGHGLVMARNPAFTDCPSPFSTSTETPGNGIVALPGFVATIPGSGVIMMPPVSVCHHVSTIGQLLPPMCSWYHIHASGLIGSPTLPSNRSDDKFDLAGHSVPQRMNARIAVGAV